MREDEYFGEEQEEDIYSVKEVEELLNDDEVSLSEESFMIGYDEEIQEKLDEKLCKFCRQSLDIEDRICPACGTSAQNSAEVM